MILLASLYKHAAIFFPVRMIGLGVSCSTRDVCLGDSTGCIDGICHCLQGYHERDQQCCEYRKDGPS